METGKVSLKTTFKNRRRCVINGCESTSLDNPSLKFFRFPPPNTRNYQAWLSVCNQSAKNIKSLKRPLVCSLHFLPEDIGGKRLNNNALPKLRLTPSQEFIDLQQREKKINLLNQIMMEWLVRNRPYRDIYGELLIEKAQAVQNILNIDCYLPDNDWLKRFNDLLAAHNSRLFRKNDVMCGVSLHIADVVQDIINFNKIEGGPPETRPASEQDCFEDSIEISDDDDHNDEDCSDGSIGISHNHEVFKTGDEDGECFEPSRKKPRLQSTKRDLKEQAKPERPVIESYTQALEYLKPLEDFVLVKEDFRAIGLLTQIEAIFSQSQ